MLLILAIGFYKLIRRFPLIVLILYVTESSAQVVTTGFEKEITEEVEVLSELQVIKAQRNYKLLDHQRNVLTPTKVVPQSKEELINRVTAYHKLYIYYCSLLIDFDGYYFRILSNY